MRKRRWILAIWIALLPVLAACSTGDGDSGGQSTSAPIVSPLPLPSHTAVEPPELPAAEILPLTLTDAATQLIQQHAYRESWTADWDVASNIVSDGEKIYFVASDGVSICTANRDGSEQAYLRTDHTLPNTPVNGLIYAENALFISYDKQGIYRVDASGAVSMLFDGVARLHAIRDGRIYFSSLEPSSFHACLSSIGTKGGLQSPIAVYSIGEYQDIDDIGVYLGVFKDGVFFTQRNSQGEYTVFNFIHSTGKLDEVEVQGSRTANYGAYDFSIIQLRFGFEVAQQSGQSTLFVHERGSDRHMLALLNNDNLSVLPTYGEGGTLTGLTVYIANYGNAKIEWFTVGLE
ncbi:DUF5050 domain-containing protein [Eubacteriales bacterium OttesenSCG-928-N14]|nr:DUF5050 domain-containing protein [Eubacteriales bacterium OttesenSCG-928-N14]